MGSACPAPWQRWLDQVDSHGSATIAASALGWPRCTSERRAGGRRLDDRGSEAALPDVAAGSLAPVVPPGVSDGQGLEDAADRLPGGRLKKQMKMVGHQAVAEERERIPCLGAGEIAKEHIPFAVGAEDIGSVVPAVDRVVNKVIACRSWKSSHESNLPT